MTETPQRDPEEPIDETPDEGPDVTELDDDPAYNPDDEQLEQIKGG